MQTVQLYCMPTISEYLLVASYISLPTLRAVLFVFLFFVVFFCFVCLYVFCFCFLIVYLGKKNWGGGEMDVICNLSDAYS